MHSLRPVFEIRWQQRARLIELSDTATKRALQTICLPFPRTCSFIHSGQLLYRKDRTMWNQGWTTSKISLFSDEFNIIEQFSAKHEWIRPSPNMYMAGSLLATRIILQVFGDICITTMTSNDGSAAEKKHARPQLWAAQFGCKYEAFWCVGVIFLVLFHLFVVFAPKTTWGTDTSFENYLISSISKLKFAFLSLQCPLKKDSPSNAGSTPPNAVNARASVPSVKPCSEERRTSAGLSMWAGGQEICDHSSWEMVDVFCCNNAPRTFDYHCGFLKSSGHNWSVRKGVRVILWELLFVVRCSELQLI